MLCLRLLVRIVDDANLSNRVNDEDLSIRNVNSTVRDSICLSIAESRKEWASVL